jgi:hypothetical protein
MNFPEPDGQAIGMIDAVLRRLRLVVREFGDRLPEAGGADLRRGGFQERQDQGVLAALVELCEGRFRARVFAKGGREIVRQAGLRCGS